ncbi:MAG: SGNH/GDSL hydrolase family protein [Rhodobacteraceae bacterium]|nr:SGNH/GDSL hydrolase family protein [Paracoccaceae bacterium]
MWFRIIQLIFLASFLVGCAEQVAREPNSRILAMGDSLMAWNSDTNRSISHAIETDLKEPVVDRSVVSARMLWNLPITGALGLSIPKQFRSGSWDWIVLNGGGNDLWLGCACSFCEKTLNRLMSRDGKTGRIADLITNLRSTGAQVVYVGYIRSPGVGSPIEYCKNEGAELERRISKFSAMDDGVHHLSNADLVPFGDRTYHSFDMIHPSAKASRKIGERVARTIRAHSPSVSQQE